MDKEKAQSIVERTFQEGRNFLEGLRVIIEHRLWETLGYGSFKELAASQNMHELNLPQELRQLVVSTLVDENPSITNMEVAKAIGTSRDTIKRDKNKIMPKKPAPLVTSQDGADAPPVYKTSPGPVTIEGTFKEMVPVSTATPVVSSISMVLTNLGRSRRAYEDALRQAVKVGASWQAIGNILSVSAKEAESFFKNLR